MNKGYPLSGTEDESGLIYLACIANKIKSSVKPWNSIKTIQEETLLKRLTGFMDRILKSNSEVSKLIEQKQTYLLTSNDNVIPEEYNLSNWNSFTPLIKPVTIKTMKGLPSNFNNSIKSLFMSGNKEQSENIYQ